MTRQDRILKAIAWYWTEHGFAPSLRDIEALTGIKGVSTVMREVKALRAAGRVSYRDRQPRTLKLVEPVETAKT
jgi:SOS-response transcriptional repressor LexA